MRSEESEASHADEVKVKKHSTFVKEICQGAMTEVPLNRRGKECDVARILDINDTHRHMRRIKRPEDATTSEFQTEESFSKELKSI